MPVKGLTIKQEKFCFEYIKSDGNASEAYRKAFGVGNRSNETLWVRASQLLNTDKVQIRVKELRAELAHKQKMTIESLSDNITLVINESKEIVQRRVGKGKKRVSRLYNPDRLLRATMDGAKLHGLIVDKSEMNGTLTLTEGGRIKAKTINDKVPKVLEFNVGEAVE